MNTLRGVKEDVCTPLAETVAFALIKGDAFLPGEGEYDDLFYKLLEAWELLPRFRKAFGSTMTTGKSAAVGGGGGAVGQFERAADALVKVSAHFHAKVGEKGLAGGRGRGHQSATEVKGVVREGYETLDLMGVAATAGGEVQGRGLGSMGDAAGFGRWSAWREGERKAEVKRLVRVAVEDARVVGMGQ